MAEIAHRTDVERKAALVAMRRTLTLQLGEFGELVDRDAKLGADPDLKLDFRRRFSAMRAAISLHQANWPAVMLDEGGEAYKASAAGVTKGNRAFIAWAKTALG